MLCSATSCGERFRLFKFLVELLFLVGGKLLLFCRMLFYGLLLSNEGKLLSIPYWKTFKGVLSRLLPAGDVSKRGVCVFCSLFQCACEVGVC